MLDWLLLIIGFAIGSVICVICSLIGAYRRSRKTWFVPVGIDGEETYLQIDDTFGGDCMMDIPTNWLYNQSGVYHHNTGTGFLPDWVLTRERFPMLADTVLQLICRRSFPDYTDRAAAELEKSIAATMANEKLSNREKAFRIKVYTQYNLGRLESVRKFADYKFDAGKIDSISRKALAEIPAAEVRAD